MTAVTPGAVWAVVPAAGVGRRMAAGRPKQYLEIAGRPVLAWTLQRLLALELVAGAVVAVSDTDPFYPRIHLDTAKPVLRAPGGAERADSVLNALEALRGEAPQAGWALVHDAVRPCFTAVEVQALAAAVTAPDGGLLALPVRDTLKRAGAGSERVEDTVNRKGLWQALTPQLFPLETLAEALRSAMGEGVTDESQAMERAGYRPRLVQGALGNIKLTHPEDLGLVELQLEALVEASA